MNQASLSSVTGSRRSTAFGPNKPLRLAYFETHPIQYRAPLLRRIAQEPDIDAHAFFASDHSVRGYQDAGFGVRVEWDVPLLEGYKHEFLPGVRQSDRVTLTRPLNWGIATRLRNGGFDAVLVFGYNLLFQIDAILSANLLGVPVLMRAEPHLEDRPRSAAKLFAKRLYMRALRPLVKGVLPIGTANRDYWAHYFGDDFPMSPMPYAVDNSFFRGKALEAASRREELRSELGLESGKPVVLYASKLQERKRCIDLVEAWIRLSPAAGAEPPGYLLIVGDGEERAALEARARQAGLSSIRFLGFKNQSELPRYFDLCDVFVLPSIHEPWALIVNEVMNAGRPVIVSDQVGCQRDLVQDGLNGFVFPAFDVGALADRLHRLMRDPKLRTSMGENGLRIIQHHSFEEDIAGLRRGLSMAVPGFSSESVNSPVLS